MKDTQNISGLRFQKYDTGVVHIHDDARSLTFLAKTKDFKKEVEGFFKQKGDGAVIIDGTSKEKLLLMREDKKITAVVLPDQQDIGTELKGFFNSL
jgi:Neuraminidase (sialidase)